MRPQRPASAAVGVSRPSPYATSGPRPFNSRPATPAAIEANTPQRGQSASTRKAHVASGHRNDNSGHSEVSALQDQLRAVLQRQAEVDAQHQRDVTAYRHRLRRLYNDNAVMRNIVSAAENRRRNGDRLSASAGPAAAGGEGGATSVTEAECEHLQTRINFATRKMNQLQHSIAQEEERLQHIREEERKAKAQLQASFEKDLFAGGNASVFLRTQKMEKKLDDVLMQQSAVGVVLRGYEHHHQALVEDGRHFEGRMLHLDAEYAARHRDHIQLVNLYQNAQDEYKNVSEEREALVRTMHRLRTAKERALAEKTSEVTAALRETQRREQHLTDLHQQQEEEAQQLEYAEHVKMQLDQRRHLSRAINDVVRDRGSGGAAAAAEGTPGSTYLDMSSGGALTAEEGERLAAYEKAFRAMMLAARVERLEDLVKAYEDEHASHDQLASQVTEERARYESLSAEVKRLRRKQEEAGGVLPSAGKRPLPLAASSNKLLAELRTFVREEEAELRRQVSANESNETLLLEVARRVDAMAEKVSAYRSDVCIPLTAEESLLAVEGSAHTGPVGATEMNSKAAQRGRATLVAHLAVLKQKLFALADDATHAHSEGLPPGAVANGNDPTAAAAAAAAVVRSTQIVIPENNVRVTFERKPVASGGLDSRKGPLQLQQQRRAWMAAEDAGSPATGSRGATPKRDSVNTEYDDDNDASALLLLSGAEADETKDTAMAAAGASSSFFDSSDGAVEAVEGEDDSPRGAGDAADSATNKGQWVNRSDDPLDRAEVKKMSEAIQLRERRRRERERMSTAAGGG